MPNAYADMDALRELIALLRENHVTEYEHGGVRLKLAVVVAAPAVGVQPKKKPEDIKPELFPGAAQLAQLERDLLDPLTGASNG